MTEKRFTLTFDDNIVDNLTGIIHEVHSGYDVAMDLSGLLNTLNDENEQLKQELTIYRKLASCSNCKYHNYDWYDDGDEFEVCDKGNDVTEGICKEWREL